MSQRGARVGVRCLSWVVSSNSGSSCSGMAATRGQYAGSASHPDHQPPSPPQPNNPNFVLPSSLGPSPLPGSPDPQSLQPSHTCVPTQDTEVLSKTHAGLALSWSTLNHSSLVPQSLQSLTTSRFPAVISQTATASPGHPHSVLQTRSVPAPWLGATSLSLYFSMGTSC